jgi:sulfur-carrier protein
MIIVNIAGFLTDFTEGRSRIELRNAAATVEDALDELWELHPGLRDRVLNERGQLRPHVNVFLDNENIRRNEQLGTALLKASEITILPAVSGGQ